MPRKYLMTWQEKKRRWVKMHQSKMYIVSCFQLNPPLDTKEASYRLANAWWQKKLIELQPKPDPATAAMKRHKEADLLDTIERGEAAKKMLNALRGDPYRVRFKEDNEEYEILPRQRTTPETILHADTELSPTPLQTDLTIGHQVQRYLDHEAARGKQPTTFQNLRYFITKLTSQCPHLKPEASVSTIKGPLLNDVYAWLRRESTWEDKQQHKAWNHFAVLVRWLWEQEIIDLPRSLQNGRWDFRGGAKPIPVYATETVRAMIAQLPSRLKLYCLLGLNCAMYPVDMGLLTWEEYSGTTIRRKRSKTRDKANVPIVEYPLWPETSELLEIHRSTHPQYVLTTEAGTPCWRPGRRRAEDAIGRQWRRNRGTRIPIAHLRHIGASKLAEHSAYKDWRQVYLGHAPATVADKHYSAHSQPLFDAAIGWLREQFMG
jgi:hypothetical protein